MLPIYASAPRHQEQIDELTRLGFDLSGVFPVTLDSSLRVIEFDGIFVRRPAASALTPIPALAASAQPAPPSEPRWRAASPGTDASLTGVARELPPPGRGDPFGG